MSAHPARERGEASDNLVPLQLDDDDLSRAIFIYRRACDEAERRHARCAHWLAAGRRVWREPLPAERLRQRRNARIAKRLSRQWLVTALRDWTPTTGGH